MHESFTYFIFSYIRSLSSDVPNQHNVKVYLYTRPLEDKELPSFQVFKHWGIVVEFLDYDQDEVLPGSFLSDAIEDNGKLRARCERFNKNKDFSNYELKLISNGKTLRTSVNKMKDFCDDWNQKNENPFNVIGNTCQDFAKIFAKKLFGLEMNDEWTSGDVSMAAIAGASLLAVGGLLFAAFSNPHKKKDDH